MQNFDFFFLIANGFLILSLVSTSLVAPQIPCDHYFKSVPSLGIAVFAGKIHEPFEPFDIAVGVPIPLEFVYSDSTLVNYVEGYNQSHALLTLGIGMLN